MGSGAPEDGVAKGQWWTAFGDKDLDQLEPLVSVNNATVAADYYAYEESVADCAGGSGRVVSVGRADGECDALRAGRWFARHGFGRERVDGVCVERADDGRHV